MINKPPPFEGLNIRIPTIIPTRGEGAYSSRAWVGPHPACKARKCSDCAHSEEGPHDVQGYSKLGRIKDTGICGGVIKGMINRDFRA